MTSALAGVTLGMLAQMIRCGIVLVLTLATSILWLADSVYGATMTDVVALSLWLIVATSASMRAATD
jgi:ABC-type Fe3+-siderophore transport system permease subunit